jgi:hypothetical protein
MGTTDPAYCLMWSKSCLHTLKCKRRCYTTSAQRQAILCSSSILCIYGAQRQTSMYSQSRQTGWCPGQDVYPITHCTGGWVGPREKRDPITAIPSFFCKDAYQLNMTCQLLANHKDLARGSNCVFPSPQGCRSKFPVDQEPWLLSTGCEMRTADTDLTRLMNVTQFLINVLSNLCQFNKWKHESGDIYSHPFSSSTQGNWRRLPFCGMWCCTVW